MHPTLCGPLVLDGPIVRNNITCAYDIHDVCSRPQGTFCETAQQITGACGPTASTNVGILLFVILCGVSLIALQPRKATRTMTLGALEAVFHASSYFLSWTLDRPTRLTTVHAQAPLCALGLGLIAVLLVASTRLKTLPGPLLGWGLWIPRAMAAGATFTGVCSFLWLCFAGMGGAVEDPGQRGPLTGFVAVVLVLLSHVVRVFERVSCPWITFASDEQAEVLPMSAVKGATADTDGGASDQDGEEKADEFAALEDVGPRGSDAVVAIGDHEQPTPPTPPRPKLTRRELRKQRLKAKGGPKAPTLPQLPQLGL